MKGMVSKIVTFCCAGVLLIAAALLPNRVDEVEAGAGKGVNEEIRTITEVSELMTSFRDQFTGFHGPSANNAAVSTSADRLEAGPEIEPSVNKYTSVTLHETSSYSVSTNVRNSGVQVRASAKGQREMTVYISEEAVYYVIDLTMMTRMSVSASGESESSNSIMSILLKVYMSDDAVLLRFDRFSLTVDGQPARGTSKFVEKWVDMTKSEDYGVQQAIQGLLSSNNENFEILALMGEYIGRGEDVFDKSGDVYTLKDDEFYYFFSTVLNIMDAGNEVADGAKGSFSVDLHNAVRPKISLDMDNSYSENHDSNSAEADYSEADDFIFCNINNTVVGRPNARGALSPEEFEQLLEEAMES